MRPGIERQTDEERSERRKLYKSWRWRAVRARQLAREPHCRLCKLRGAQIPAQHVDHIAPVPSPVLGHLHDFWNGALQSLCVGCHSRKTITEKRGAPYVKGCDADGTPVDPNAHCHG